MRISAPTLALGGPCCCSPYGYYDRIKPIGDGVHANMNARDYFAIGGTLNELQSLPEAEDYMTVKFVCDIGISRELCRHRQMSFMERSTRYCNMKDGIEFILPVPFDWAKEHCDGENYLAWRIWKHNCIFAEKQYARMLELGFSPQEARSVLPLSTATVLYVTGMIHQWRDVLKLRLDRAAHPQMRYLMRLLVELPDCPDELKKEFA